MTGSSILRVFGMGPPNKNQQTRLCSRSPNQLDFNDVLGLKSFWTFSYSEFHGLALAQRFEPRLLNGRMVHEDILARFALNKAIALRIIEPFYGSFLLHSSFVSFLKLSSPVFVT